MRIIIIVVIGSLVASIKLCGQPLKDFSLYLNSKQVSKNAKDYYNNKFKASDDGKTLSIIDSLKSKNDETRPFYIFLVSRMMIKSDGALSEALGDCKDFLENHPDYAIDFLYSNNSLDNKIFVDNWAKTIAGEFAIDCEGKAIQCVNESLQKTITKCRTDNQFKLTEFYQKVQNYCR
jgi:hypothetical protein